jgi:hypothetical protein
LCRNISWPCALLLLQEVETYYIIFILQISESKYRNILFLLLDFKFTSEVLPLVALLDLILLRKYNNTHLFN